MALHGQQFNKGDAGQVDVEAWQQRRPAAGTNSPPRRKSTAAHRTHAGVAHISGRPRRHGGAGGSRSHGRVRQRQVWRGGRGGPPRRRRRRRKNWMPLVLLCLCLLLVTAGVVKLIGGGKGKGGEAQPTGEVETLQVTPYNGETFVLVLDAGHGGDDPGALNPDETIYESTITREMLNRLCDLFAQRQPDAVRLLTTTEEGETLHSREQRAAIANSAGADLFLSLHLNSDKKSSVNGFQAYAQPPSMATNARSVYFAEILAGKVGEKTNLKLIGGSGVYYMFYEDASTPHPYEYTSGINSGHAGLDTFGVLQHANCPAVLIEQWYITNSGDMATMYTDEGMNAMAESIYAAVCSYFGLEA